LRECTRDAHEEIEARVPLLSPGVSRDDYRTYLERMYGVHSAAEEQVHSSRRLREAIALDLVARRRVPSLTADLVALGVPGASIAVLPRCAVPPVATPAEAMGVLYVLEGSTLGAVAIARALRERLPTAFALASAYVSAYGAETARRWREVQDALVRTAASTVEADVIVAHAKRTFDALRDSFR
jgi:heme oxygenase